MVKYSLEIKQSAQKELDALEDTLFTRIDRKILALADNPRPAGCKKLRGYKDQWRIRIGDWRVLYIVDDQAKVITITGVAHRSEVY
ncbi:MAG: type II toxin-antitoxin system RelE/ParE family toxin [Bryobacteraceae bacterium]